MVDERRPPGRHDRVSGNLPRDYILEMVHRFYDEYYFRPKAIFRIVSKAVFNSDRSQASVQRGQVVPEAARGAQPDGERSPPAAGAGVESADGNADQRSQVGDG